MAKYKKVGEIYQKQNSSNGCAWIVVIIVILVLIGTCS